MKRYALQPAYFLILVFHVAVAVADDEPHQATPDYQLRISPESKLTNGKMVVCWKQVPSQSPTHVLIHFHGDPNTVTNAYARSDGHSALVIINFPGLSSAYSKPFQADRDLFQQILYRARDTVVQATVERDTKDWQRVSVSSFSAGYGAVREILKSERYFELIDDLVAVDSIYAGLENTKPSRQVDRQNMRDFLRFAKHAVDNKKSFTLSHSAQSTPYASTTETADYLLSALGIDRRPDASIQSQLIRLTSRASQGQFIVLGFDGAAGQDHMRHLHQIELFWKHLHDDSL